MFVLLVSMRKIFSKFGIDQFEAPNLVQVQLDSYKWFLDVGLRELLKDVSPTEDWTEKNSNCDSWIISLMSPSIKNESQ